MPEITPQVVSNLKEEVGEPLRLVAEYSSDSYEIHYFRDDVRSKYTNKEIEEIADDLVLDGLSTQRMESLFDAGKLYCSINSFEQATMCQFMRNDFGGLFITIDTEPSVNVLELVLKCKELVAEETATD